MSHTRSLAITVATIGVIGIAACGEDPPTSPPVTAAADGVTANLVGHRTVNSLADPGDGTCNVAQCTLREAINASGSTDIGFAAGLTGTITLAAPAAGGGSLEIDKLLTIAGPSAGITVRRRPTDPQFRLLTIGSAGKVAISKLSFRGGRTSRPGGGISTFGSLILTDCKVAGNRSSQHGGGIDTHGPLTLIHTTVADNTAGGTGGGIDNHGATLRLTNSNIAGNAGGGIFGGAGTLLVTGGTVSHNTGSGGIFQDWGKATLTGVTITGNSGGGIGFHRTTATITSSTIAANAAEDGGGIANFAGRLTVAKTTVSGNTASHRGGGVYNTVGDPFGRLDAFISLTNSTISGNAADSGAGIANLDRLGGATVVVTNSTVAFNSARIRGGGVHQADGLENPNGVLLANALVGRNTAPAGPDVLGSFGARFSLIGDGTGSDIANTDGNRVGNVTPNGSPIDPKLGPLAANGGPTLTHALLPGSPAIDAAGSADCPGKDQRGVNRPQGAACDIGSYERQ
jgi:CSLREA domain-containing protein